MCNRRLLSHLSSRSISTFPPFSPPLLGVSSWWVKTGHCYPRASPDRGWRWRRWGGGLQWGWGWGGLDDVDECECECEGVDCVACRWRSWVPQARLPPSGANIVASRENIFELNLHNCSNWADRNTSNPPRWSAPAVGEVYLEFSLVLRREASPINIVNSPTRKHRMEFWVGSSL